MLTDTIKLLTQIKNIVLTSNSWTDDAKKHVEKSFDEAIEAVAKVKQGKWIDDADDIDSRFGKHDYRCSECGELARYFIGGTENWWCVQKPNFCPNCGAKMRGEIND